MQFIPVKTGVLHPPQDNLFQLLDEYLSDVQEGDVVLITSKVVAIHQGRCVPIKGSNKAELIEKEADYLIDRPYWKWPLAIKYNTFLASAGIDESNSGAYYALLPEDPFKAAEDIYRYLIRRHKLQNVGVIITDSHLTPLRWGVTNISISFWGIEPVDWHKGKEDLFGRKIQASSTNMIDGIAAGAGIVSGESNECHPVVIARNVPNLRFIEEDRRKVLLVDPKEDVYRVLFEKYIT